MSVDVQSVGDSNAAQSSQHSEPATETSSRDETRAANTDHGRDSRIGEQSFSATLARAQLERVTTGFAGRIPPDPPPGPRTFNAEDRVPEHVFPPAGNNGPNATPQEAAEFIRSLEFSIAGNTQQTQAQFFVQALRDHRNQPAWTQQFFRSLGSSKTAELIENSVTPGLYQYSSERDFNSSVAVVRDALAGLARDRTLFNQQDMNMLVGKMAQRGFNPWVASELFSKMSWRDESVKNMFFRAASNLATEASRNGRSANELAAAASNVLASTSMDNQAVQLNRLRTEGRLSNFIQRAMTGPREMPTLWSAIQSTQSWTPVEFQNYSHVDGLLLNASLVDVRDPLSGPLPISAKELFALRTEMFNAAALALTSSRIQDAYENNDMFKDAMTRIYIRQFDQIMNSGLGSNGAGFDTIRFQPALEKFFQTVMFSPNPSNSSRELSNFLAERLTQYGQALMDTSPGAEERFRNQFGRSRMDGAAIAGGTLGMLTNALRASKDDLIKDAEARAGAVKFVLDVALGFVPGIGGRLAAGVENTIAKTLIEKTLGPVQNKVLDLIKTGAVDEAKRLILDQYKNKDPETALLGLFNALNQTIPNGDEPGEQNFLTQFQSSYSTAINSPYRITR
jgi:hypothetical protein